MSNGNTNEQQGSLVQKELLIKQIELILEARGKNKSPAILEDCKEGARLCGLSNRDLRRTLFKKRQELQALQSAAPQKATSAASAIDSTAVPAINFQIVPPQLPAAPVSANPKKETIKINLPPKPTAAPFIKIPGFSPLPKGTEPVVQSPAENVLDYLRSTDQVDVEGNENVSVISGDGQAHTVSCLDLLNLFYHHGYYAPKIKGAVRAVCNGEKVFLTDQAILDSIVLTSAKAKSIQLEEIWRPGSVFEIEGWALQNQDAVIKVESPTGKTETPTFTTLVKTYKSQGYLPAFTDGLKVTKLGSGRQRTFVTNEIRSLIVSEALHPTIRSQSALGAAAKPVKLSWKKRLANLIDPSHGTGTPTR